jgi:hypothetical protein
MTFLNSKDRIAVFATKLLTNSMIPMAFCIGSAVCALAQEAQPKDKGDSWTVTTETSYENAIPSRMTESHSKSGNRSVDKQRVEVFGLNHRYQPAFETEKETIRVNDTTTRTVVRTYNWDENGRRKLVRVTEEEARSTANGDVQAVRTTSDSGINGNLQIVQREVADTRQTSADAQETKTTVYLADGNGRFTTTRQTQELQKRSDDHRIEEKQTTLLPDGNGNFKVAEVKEKTIQEDGKNRTAEERVSRSDLNGRLSETSRTVDQETETAEGEKSHTVDTYSTNNPGLTGDGQLHLNQRVSTVQKKDSNGEITEQQIEQPNPGNPHDRPQVRAKTKYVVRYAAPGTQETKTTQERDINGNWKAVSIQTRKSDEPPPAAATTSDKPQ